MSAHFIHLFSKTSQALLYRTAGILVTALLSTLCLPAAPAQAEPVILNVDVLIDQASPGAPSKIGQHDKLHLVYDDAAINPVTHHVRLLNVQHFIHGAFEPRHPDAVMMPTNDAWLDLSHLPYRFHFKANVVHGDPITIIVDESTGRLSIFSQKGERALIESGICTIDPVPIRGEQAAVASTL